MDYLVESLWQALILISTLDRQLLQIIVTSLYASICGVLIASCLGIPMGVLVGLKQFRGRRLIITLLNTLMALPTVVVGLILYGLFSRQGPFGSLGLLFTPTAIIIGLSILTAPLIANYSLTVVVGADQRILTTATTLGASPLQAKLLLIREIRFGVVAAVVVGFGRAISEVGVAMMLGGNIRGSTRTMTTAIALETSKGEFAFGLALGIILLLVALLVNLLLNYFQQKT